MCGNHTVSTAVKLTFIKILVFVGGVIKNLELTHTDIRAIALTRITNQQTIVTTGWQFKFKSELKVTVCFFVVVHGTFASDQGTINDLEAIGHLHLPAFCCAAVKQTHPAITGCRLGEDLIGFHRQDLTHGNVTPRDWGSVCL